MTEVTRARVDDTHFYPYLLCYLRKLETQMEAGALFFWAAKMVSGGQNLKTAKTKTGTPLYTFLGNGRNPRFPSYPKILPSILGFSFHLFQETTATDQMVHEEWSVWEMCTPPPLFYASRTQVGAFFRDE